jgi:hypothetical protein
MQQSPFNAFSFAPQLVHVYSIIQVSTGIDSRFTLMHMGHVTLACMLTLW